MQLLCIAAFEELPVIVCQCMYLTPASNTDAKVGQKYPYLGINRLLCRSFCISLSMVVLSMVPVP